MIEQQRDRQSANNQNQKKKYKVYKPNIPSKGVFGFTNKYDLTFPTMKNSLITSNIFRKAKFFINWQSSLSAINLQLNQAKQTAQFQKQMRLIKNPQFKAKSQDIRLTWIGHASVMISFWGVYHMLIDPVFEKRCSPVSFAGPERIQEAPCDIQKLPVIDFVLISHDHFDHCEVQTFEKLFKKNEKIVFIAGKDSQDLFPKKSNKHMLNWTEKIQFDFKKDNNSKMSIQITFVPACHWSGRIGDNFERLWGGFVLQAKNNYEKKTIYFAGDTGYDEELFTELSQQFGNFELGIIPIGAYEPREDLKCQHINPCQAVKIHKKLNCKQSVGIHWGTFLLSSQGWKQPKIDLQKQKKQAELSQNSFITLPHGGHIDF